LTVISFAMESTPSTKYTAAGFGSARHEAASGGGGTAVKEPIRIDRAPAPKGPYSQGWRAGDFIYTAGQGATDPATGQYPGPDITSQTHQVLRNIETILGAAGARMGDIRDFDAFNAAYRQHFEEPYPSRTTVGAQLSHGLKVEIEAIAYVGPR
jgi:2-iminobutanoate/2-iminopropanoate deaminase